MTGEYLTSKNHEGSVVETIIRDGLAIATKCERAVTYEHTTWRFVNNRYEIQDDDTGEMLRVTYPEWQDAMNRFNVIKEFVTGTP